MHILDLRVHYEHGQCGWSYGYCPQCAQASVVRIENVWRIETCNGFVIHKRQVGSRTRCDFCERPDVEVQTIALVTIQGWSPQEGLIPLLERLNLPTVITPTGPPSETRLRALLDSAQRSSALGKIHFGFGIPAGLLIGGAAGVALAAALSQGFQVQLLGDAVLFALAVGLVGAIVGGVVAGVSEGRRKQESLAYTRLRNTWQGYQFDLKQLEDLAYSYPARVRNAVRRLRDSVSANEAPVR